MIECQFPHLAPLTGYIRGCHCTRCGEYAREYFSEYKRTHREANNKRRRERYLELRRKEERECQLELEREHRRELKRAYAREYYRLNRRALGNKCRKNTQRYQSTTAAQATVFGRWSPEEDEVLLNWTSTVTHLAFYLGRTYSSVRNRAQALRRQACLAA